MIPILCFLTLERFNLPDRLIAAIYNTADNEVFMLNQAFAFNLSYSANLSTSVFSNAGFSWVTSHTVKKKKTKKH